jgi:DNA-binding response OmpR family regulator
VDDEPWLTDLYTLLLEPVGYRVQGFQNRLHAADAFRTSETKPELLITDFVGYPISADRLMRLCRAEAPDLKILMVTGCDASCLSVGAEKPDQFVQKPFELEELVTAVRALL